MSTLTGLKQELGFNQDLGDIIDILKAVSLMQFHSFRSRERPHKIFFSEIASCFDLLPQDAINHPYLAERKDKPCALVVITSDDGFLGEQDILLINACLNQRKSKEDQILVLGERGAKYLEDLGEDFIFFPGIQYDIKYKDIEDLSSQLLRKYTAKFSQVIIVYPEFITLTAQIIRAELLLPYAQFKAQKKSAAYIPLDFLVEPSQESVIEGLVELWLAAKLMDIFWSAKQAELAARIMHLEGSAQEISGLNQKLAFNYFRFMHRLSDKAIREISSAKILLGRKAQ